MQNHSAENTQDFLTENLTDADYSKSYLYKRLLMYVKPWWFTFSISIIGFILYSGSGTAFAEVTKQMVDTIASGHAKAYRLYFPLLVIGLFLLRGMGIFLGNYYIEKVGRMLVHSLRVDIFNHLLELPTMFYNKHSYGHLVSRITFNVEQVTGAATSAITILLREGLFVIGVLGYLLWINWKLTLIILAVVPLVAIIMKSVSKRFTRYSKRIQDSMGDVTHIAGETISNINLIKAFGGQQQEKQRFLAASDYNIRQTLKMVMTKTISSPVIQILVVLALSVLIYLAMSPNLLGDLTSGEFVAFIMASALIIKPIKQLADVNSVIQKGLAASKDIFSLIDAPVELDKGNITMQRAHGNIKFENVNFRYESNLPLVLKNLNLTINAGEKVALVGKSGGGKTSLVNLIPRFYELESGAIYLDDIDISNLTLQSLRAQIAIVSQEIAMFNTSLRNNITYGMQNVSEDQLQRAVKSAYVDEFSNKMQLGLETIVGDRGVNLSGGQKQRVAIARAIIKNAPILILDEATSALDNQSEKFIQQALQSVMQNRTTLIIAHRLSTIENVDRILVIDNGSVVEMGTHSELMAQNGIYKRLREQNKLDLN